VKTNLREGKRRGENKHASNNSMDVRRKQRLCLPRRPLLFTSSRAVSAHVISAVKRFFEKTIGYVKNNKWFCAGRKKHSAVCGVWFPATPRLTSQ
jgi:hypothetical protein